MIQDLIDLKVNGLFILQYCLLLCQAELKSCLFECHRSQRLTSGSYQSFRDLFR